jgi:transposase
VWFPSRVVAVVEVEHDDQEIIQRVAALDIGKAELVCCVRVPGPGRRRLQEVRTFSTMTRSLLMMSNWLGGPGVTRVVMEATSDYWKPPFYLLEGSFETWLVNAKDVKHLPGRPKTDRLDAVWLCKGAERQMLRPSFVPPEPIRMLRDLTRYRVDLIGARTAEKQRVEKLLEDAQIKVSVVATDIFGVSGRAMMTALIAGERDPETLADMARGSMRKKSTQLREAFIGRFNDHHAFLLTKMLARIDQLGADIADVEERTSAQIAAFASAVARLDEILGIGVTAAQAIIAEIGLDMTRFPTPAHLSSWANFAPGIKESAGRKKGNGATGHGNRYLARVLGEAAVSAGRTDTFLGERYRRIARGRGKKKAAVAVGRSILVIIWHLLSDPQARFVDLGPDFYDTRMGTQRAIRNHILRLQDLGYRVTLEPAARPISIKPFAAPLRSTASCRLPTRLPFSSWGCRNDPAFRVRHGQGAFAEHRRVEVRASSSLDRRRLCYGPAEETRSRSEPARWPRASWPGALFCQTRERRPQ